VSEFTPLSGSEFQMVNEASENSMAVWQKLFEFEEQPDSARGLTAITIICKLYFDVILWAV